MAAKQGLKIGEFAPLPCSDELADGLHPLRGRTSLEHRQHAMRHHSMTMSLIVRSGARVRSDRDLHPQRAPSRCRLFQCSGVIDTILEDRDLDRYALDLFVAEREQLLLAVGERFYNIAGYHAGDVMGFCCFSIRAAMLIVLP